MAKDLIHGANVSYLPEDRVVGGAGEYGVFPGVEGVSGVMVWPGINASFSIDVEETYEEIPFIPADGAHSLECVRNIWTGEELPFSLTAYPQKGMDLPLLQYITGATGGFGDEPDSTSWLKELDSKYSLFTGVMFEDYKAELPAKGAMKETISGFAGHRVAISGTFPALTKATMETATPLTWGDITSIKMGVAESETDIAHCLSDISFGFTSEIDTCVHPSSALTTKLWGVRVVSRKMFVSLKLKWVDQTFLDIVTGSTKQTLILKLKAAGTEITTLTFGGLYFPKYIAKVEPKTLAGDTVTCIVDNPTFTIGTAEP